MGRYRVLPIGSVAMATIIVVRHYGSEGICCQGNKTNSDALWEGIGIFLHYLLPQQQYQ